MDDELTDAQVDALVNPEGGDREVLVSLLRARIGRWPWWDGSWRLIGILQVQVRQITTWLHLVTITGSVGRDTGETLPLSVFTRVQGERLERFEMRVGDTVIGSPIRDGEPHPFGAILCALMDRRGISRHELARRCKLADSTVAKMRAGFLVPQGDRVVVLAAALEMAVGDLLAITGGPAQA